MAIRRPTIDVIDAGLDPRVAYSRLSKQGHLISSRELSTAPVLSPVDMKEHLLVDDKKDVLTEGDEALVAETNEVPKPTIRSAKPIEVKKTNRIAKPA